MSATERGSVLERTVLKEGALFLVTNPSGDILAGNRDGQGLYYQDTRYLSILELDLGGPGLMLLASSGEFNFMDTLQFANDTVYGPDGSVDIPARTVSIRRNRFLSQGLHERLGFLNYGAQPVQLRVRLTFGADFRDMFDVRGYAVPESNQRGQLLPPSVENGNLTLRYQGLDQTERQSRITLDPRPTRLTVLEDEPRSLEFLSTVDGREVSGLVPPSAIAEFDLDLQPGIARSITLHVLPLIAGEVPPPHVALDQAFVNMRESYRRWDSTGTQIETDHESFDQLLRGARNDLRLLTDDFDGDLVPAAGIPWFAVPFGRDSLITALQTLPLRSDIAAGTLRFLARLQGTRVDNFRDEEPGKILHEVRLGELAQIGLVPHRAYYGSVDSTALFLITLGEYLAWTGDLEFIRALLPNAERALDWLDTSGDFDGDGFVEYQSRSARGIANQGWKDSRDAMVHADGSLAETPLALVEVQAYTYAARRTMAQVYRCLEQPERAARLDEQADALRHRFLRDFAVEIGGTPYWAMALDGRKRPLAVVSSNPGHALWAGLLRGQEADRTVRRLMAEDMLSGWGIRSLSNRATAFNPMSYHRGSIWPHDNALIALGMKRVGADAAATEVVSQVFEAVLRIPGYRLPELYCGFSRDRVYRSMPAQYPVSCSPQAWAAGSAFMLLQALLGLEPDALGNVLRLRPMLPLWLSQVRIRKLRVGGKRVDLDIFREGHRVIVDVLDDGGLRVEAREAPPDQWAARGT